MNVLVVEDEPGIASFLTKGLAARGYDVGWVACGRDALAASAGADLVVLDLGLPDVDGLDVLREIRRRGDATAVLVLTARSEVEDVVTGLELGADDYLVKPFAFDELVARVRTRERAVRAAASMTALEAGDVLLDLTDRTARVGGRPIHLSRREFDLLRAFVASPDQLLTRPQLLEAVWGLNFDPGTNIVDVYVRTLRRKIGAERIRDRARAGLPARGLVVRQVDLEPRPGGRSRGRAPPVGQGVEQTRAHEEDRSGRTHLPARVRADGLPHRDAQDLELLVQVDLDPELLLTVDPTEDRRVRHEFRGGHQHVIEALTLDGAPQRTAQLTPREHRRRPVRREQVARLHAPIAPCPRPDASTEASRMPTIRNGA